MSIRYEKDENQIVTLTLDLKDRGANVLGPDLLEPFAKMVDELEQDKELKGVVLASAKKDWVAGADLEYLFANNEPEAVMRLTETFKVLARRLEKLGKPVVAALNGSALGGGLELALACHYRVALRNPRAKFGFPEVKLGLLPGGGGTQRLPRMIGIQTALPHLIEGKDLKVDAALKAGFIDAIAETPEDLVAMARTWIGENKYVAKPWDKKGFRWPGGDSKRPDNAQMWAIAPSMMHQKTRGNYPAVKNILACVYEGSWVDFDTASRIESRYFTQLATSQTATNMINAFWFQRNRINKGESRPKGFEKRLVQKVGILGAGMMGAGIAAVSALAGIEVVLKDVAKSGAEKGKDVTRALVKKRVDRGRMDQEKADQVLGRILTTDHAADLQGCDLIIEAVFEDRELKAKVTAEAEARIEADAVFASNTSTLPITGLAEASQRPENFIGLHFFSPVDKMPLVEIIVGEKTTEETLARAFDYVQQIKKTPIVVNDSRGFYTSRVFSTYVQEGMALVREGQHPRAIEHAGLEAGMPVGPLALIDEVSLSLIHNILSQTKRDMEAEGKTHEGHPGDPVVTKMVEDLKRPGKKAAAGFYDYPDNGKKHLWPELGKHFPLAADQLSQAEMQERMMFVQALETVRCLDEGVLTRVADANIGSIFGWGFAPFKGGTLQYINDVGLKTFCERAEALEAKWGKRFAVPQRLRDMAAKGEIFQ
ncbi:3-hydroxyacyl-CoA dehydrogenase NAD-binding domain-containing protein [Acanthopleuribacter pedis]|uniref:enoyl-CoA hydratase n=1 Tax=Acanthopleuribacter pedis TaxID=442870 RepID=A0A8J7Q7P1_9BACT|nr:3-hydroxyacyl-CoA dehydrogenase NAD-binding domain-containing protein [Acanthopleuribacter pedis]MBO1319891.1 enoyl-CoA hydratase/isomerase family protein [Acanthopleuribacter pedis]